MSSKVKASKQDQHVVLNVGGRLIETRTSTLQSVPVLLNQWCMKTLPVDEAGVPFLDRDPDAFAAMLSELRGYALFNKDQGRLAALERRHWGDPSKSPIDFDGERYLFEDEKSGQQFSLLKEIVDQYLPAIWDVAHSCFIIPGDKAIDVHIPNPELLVDLNKLVFKLHDGKPLNPSRYHRLRRWTLLTHKMPLKPLSESLDPSGNFNVKQTEFELIRCKHDGCRVRKRLLDVLICPDSSLSDGVNSIPTRKLFKKASRSSSVPLVFALNLESRKFEWASHSDTSYEAMQWKLY